MNIKHLLAVLALTVTASAAHAADEAFSKIDTDSSGTITRGEATALPALSEQWAILDSNMDGALDEAEFAKFEPESSE